MTLTDSMRALLGGRRIGALSTLDPDGSPHVIAVWYLLEGEDLFVATSRRSRKARNVAARPRAALMVDVRTPGTERGVMASGRAELLTGAESQAINLRLHERYLRADALADPGVGPVFAALDDVTIRLRPERWVSWDMAALDRQMFGGRLAGRFLPLDET